MSKRIGTVAWLLLGGLLPACRSPVAPATLLDGSIAQSRAHVVGRYALLTWNDAPLPIVVATNADGCSQLTCVPPGMTMWLTEESLTIAADGSVTRVKTFRTGVQPDAAAEVTTKTEQGTYHVLGRSISMDFGDGVHCAGMVGSARALSISMSPAHVLTYRR